MANLDFSSVPQDSPIPSSSTSAFDVFINHNDPNVQITFASHLHRRLRDHGLRVCFNRLQLPGGANLTCEIEDPIREASVLVPVFSPGYVESSWCLNELMLRMESGLTIIPVFYGVQPSELRRTKLEDTGVYAKALRNFEEKKTFDSNTIEKWRKALYEVAGKSGFELEAYNRDEGKLVDKIVRRVLKKLENRLYYNVFINHRGPDVKKTFASHLYHCLVAHGLQVFLDAEELQKGDRITSQIEGAIGTASIHIAIFSPRYAESPWCLNELLLMLKSQQTILPVFYNVNPLDLWSAKHDDGEYGKALMTLKEKTVYDYQSREWKPRYDADTVAEWKKALSGVSYTHTSGFKLKDCNGDEGELVQQVVQRVLSEIAEKYTDRRRN